MVRLSRVSLWTRSHRIGGMTPEEFRAAGHQIVDWIADYRATVASRPVMARTEPGDVRKQLPPQPPEQPEAVRRRSSAISIASSSPASRIGSIRSSSATSPATAPLASVLGDYVSTGLGVLGPGVAIEPRAHRARGGGHRLDARDARAVRRVERRDPGHGVDQHADRPDLRARADDRHTDRAAAVCRPNRSRSIVYTSAHSHSSVDKAALLAGFGRENIRLVAARRALRDAARRAGRRRSRPTVAPAPGPARSSRRPAAPRRRRSIRSTRSRRSRRSTSSGCMSMPRWPARR